MIRAPDERFQYESLRLAVVPSAFGDMLAYLNDRGMIVEYLEEVRSGVRYRSVLRMMPDAAEKAECEARRLTRWFLEMVK